MGALACTGTYYNMLSKQLALAPLLGALIVLTLTGTMFVSNVRYARLDAHPGRDTNRSLPIKDKEIRGYEIPRPRASSGTLSRGSSATRTHPPWADCVYMKILLLF